jgi:hypothetical protein
MRPRLRHAALVAACLLAGAIAAGCTTPPVHSAGVFYTCCDDSVVSTRWHPGQQLTVGWTRTATVPAGHHFEAVTLSAVLTGPFSHAAALKSAISQGHHGSLTVQSAKITISRDPPASAASVITIPASAPPGFYDLETTESSGGGTVAGESVITVG